MAILGQTAQPGLLAGALQSYGRDWRRWTTGVVVRYAVAVVLFLGAGAGVIGAISVGIGALLHWLDTKYGAYPAYGIVAAALLLLGVVSALAALALLRQSLSPVPRPHRYAAAVGRSAAARTVLAVSRSPATLKADAGTEVMIGLAAVCLLGWLVSSRLGRGRPKAGDR